MKSCNKYKVPYSTVKALGFEEIEGHDSVWFEQYGYPYKIIQHHLKLDVYVQWHQDTQQCELVRLKDYENGEILIRTELSAEAFCDVMNYFSTGKRLVQFNPCAGCFEIQKPWA
jgi:hypothetical protein